MSQLPSLSLGNIPWSTPHRYRPVGGGGRKWSHEDSLISSLDEVSSWLRINFNNTFYNYTILSLQLYWIVSKYLLWEGIFGDILGINFISDLLQVIIPTHDDDDNDSTVMNESQTWKYKMFEWVFCCCQLKLI